MHDRRGLGAGSRSRDEGANTSDEGAAARAETVARTTGAGRLAADGEGVCRAAAAVAATAAAGASAAGVPVVASSASCCRRAGSAVRGERAVDTIRPYTLTVTAHLLPS